MKLQESIRRHAVACNVVHFLPGRDKYLACVCVRRRCSLLKRDYLPTLDRAPDAKTRAEQKLSCTTRGFPFLSLPSLRPFRNLLKIFVVSFVFSAYISFFLLLSFFEKRGRGERLASVNPGIFLDKIYGNSIDTRGLFVLQAFDIYIEKERKSRFVRWYGRNVMDYTIRDYHSMDCSSFKRSIFSPLSLSYLRCDWLNRSIRLDNIFF